MTTVTNLELREQVAREVIDHGLPTFYDLANEIVTDDVRRDLPAYESSIEAAWEVIEKMREAGWWLNMNRFYIWFERNNIETPDHNYIRGPEIKWVEGQETQGISPRLICNVALAAVRSRND